MSNFSHELVKNFLNNQNQQYFGFMYCFHQGKKNFQSKWKIYKIKTFKKCERNMDVKLEAFIQRKNVNVSKKKAFTYLAF